MRYTIKTISHAMAVGLLVIVGLDLSGLSFGNFTAQDYLVSIQDRDQNSLVNNFLIKEQHYIDLGTISDTQLPITVRVWEKDEIKREESTILSEFIIENVASLKIDVSTTDMWLMYTDENNELQVTNLVKQPIVMEVAGVDDSQPSVTETSPALSKPVVAITKPVELKPSTEPTVTKIKPKVVPSVGDSVARPVSTQTVALVGQEVKPVVSSQEDSEAVTEPVISAKSPDVEDQPTEVI